MVVLQTLFIIYICVVAFGTLFSGVMYWIDREPVYRANLQLWVSALITFGAQAICSNLELTGFLSISTCTIHVLTFLHIFGLCFDVKLPMKTYVKIVLVGIGLSILFFLAKLSFTVSNLPYGIALLVVSLHVMYLGIKKAPNTALRNCHLFLIGFSTLHNSDYPFLRPDPNMAVFGFSLALVLDFCFASFIPLVIVKTQAQKSTQLLESKVAERTRELQNANLVLSEAQNSLSLKNEELQKLSDHNRALTSVLVHDLATPIAVVQNSLPRLESLLESETDKKVFGRVSRSIATLAETTDRVRNEHAVRTGKKATSANKARLAEVIERMAHDFENALSDKQLKLKIENCAGADLLVEAEAETLKNQVLSNLLSNAIKFSHRDGTIAISVDARDGEVFVRFQDNGIGVPLTMREEIFRDDRPTTSSGTNGEAGTGFGLPIVRHFVRQMGGDVRVSDSQNDSGACFEVTLKRSA